MAVPMTASRTTETEKLPANPQAVSGSAGALVAVFVLFNLALGWSTAAGGMRGDFSSSYMGAAMVREGKLKQLYDYQTQAQWWRAHVSEERVLVPYVRPPYYAVLEAPLTALPLPRLFAVNLVTLSVLLIGCWIWFARRLGENALVLASLFLPAALGISMGQDLALMLALAVLSYHLYARDREFAAGAVLGLALFKYHLLLLIGPAMLLGGRRRMFGGFASSGAVFGLISVLLIGPAGISDYARLIFRKDLEGLYPSLELMTNWNGLLANFRIVSPAAVLLLSAATVAWALIASWKAPWWRGMAASIAGAILIVPHVFGYDLTVLLLGMILASQLSQSKLTRATAAWLCFPICYMAAMFEAPWSALTSLSLAAFLFAMGWESLTERRRPLTNG
jgi:hypothetical protein